jgi:hypothetical protein
MFGPKASVSVKECMCSWLGQKTKWIGNYFFYKNFKIFILDLLKTQNSVPPCFLQQHGPPPPPQEFSGKHKAPFPLDF